MLFGAYIIFITAVVAILSLTWWVYKRFGILEGLLIGWITFSAFRNSLRINKLPLDNCLQSYYDVQLGMAAICAAILKLLVLKYFGRCGVLIKP